MHDQSMSGAKSRLDGRDLRGMFSAATRLFERNVESVNALNVFPVPDGDTGTNMFITLRESTRQAECVSSDSADEVAAAMARGALLEARGNSGVILCEFFHGIALGLEGKRSFGPGELATALTYATQLAYKAVGEPVEGTLLTVISEVADVARAKADSDVTIQEMMDAICVAAREAVALTPTMLPVLREAKVVDAGGQGLWVILEGFRSYVHGQDVEPREIPPPDPIGVEAAVGRVSTEFLDATDKELYGYCIHFLIHGRELGPETVREKLASLAQSTVVVGDGSVIKAHVHALDPGPVISFAVSIGTLSQVKIESMDEQRQEYATGRRQESRPGPSASTIGDVAVVAVAWGVGLETVFKDLGAAEVMAVGDTMNPSVQEIVDAVESVPCDDVIFLPNNRNIVPAARRAIGLSQKRVTVLPTTTIPQGIAAILAFNAERAVEDNVSEMEGVMSKVRTGEVCHAVRPVELNGVSVKEGQLIGLLERELVAAGDEPNDVLMSLLNVAGVAESELVTLYWGGELSQEEADSARHLVQDALPEAEVEVVAGGQPHYHYIVSIE